MSGITNSLLEQLQHPDPKQRSKAVLALNDLDERSKLPVLIEALRSEPDLFVREDITYAITRMGSAALPSLIDQLTDSDAQIRHNAVHTLGKIAHQDAVDALVQTLTDAETFVVCKVVLALSQIGDDRALPALIGLLGHPDLEVQNALMNALEQFDAVSLPLLIEALKSDQYQVREHAADILGALGHQEAVPALIVVLGDDHWQVRFAAAMALGHIGGRTALEALSPLKHDPNPRVRELASALSR
jgi:HEAT repeat protein